MVVFRVDDASVLQYVMDVMEAVWDVQSVREMCWIVLGVGTSATDA